MRITKLTDYGILILCEMDESSLVSAKKISDITKIPYATVNKVLRLLVNGGICSAKGGKQGGFYLNKPKKDISMLDIISSIEGLYNHLTECLDVKNNPCALANHCKINNKMNLIDKEIYNLLKNKFLSDLSS